MDLRERRLNEETLRQFELYIRQRKLIYQPFVFTDDLEVGEGKNFYDGVTPQMGCIYWPNHPADVADLVVKDRDHFRRCNDGYRLFYEHHLDECVRLLGGDISQHTFAEVGCNTGYSMLGSSLRGAKRSIGYDFTPNQDVVKCFNGVLGTNTEFHFAEWDSLAHRLQYAEMEEVDVVLSTAVMCHVADPLYHLAYLCDRARQAIFIWTPVNQFFEPLPALSHWRSDLALSYGPPNRHKNSLPWPLGFDFNMRFSVPLLKLCLAEAGFETIHEISCPHKEPRWRDIWSTFRAFMAFRTKPVKSALATGLSRRALPAEMIGRV
jgi:SAM-dependent methyltransferase